MDMYNIIVTFYTVVYDVLVTDLFINFYNLIRNRERIKWHWMLLLSAWYLFLVILKNWRSLITINGSVTSMNIYLFIAYGHLLFVIFLAVLFVFSNIKPNI